MDSHPPGWLTCESLRHTVLHFRSTVLALDILISSLSRQLLDHVLLQAAKQIKFEARGPDAQVQFDDLSLSPL